jgi:tetratricopeptide (TPR) repeat protein
VRTWLSAVAIGAWLIAPAPARADVLDKLGKTIGALAAESQKLGQGVHKPSGQARKADVMARRLIDAQVEFGTGNYETAALLLYDYVQHQPRGRDHDTALYYLAEALFQKGDRVAARTYFTEVVGAAKRSKFYQQSLERLVELSLLLRDTADVDAWLAALDAVPAGERKPSVPYVRGKYAFSLAQYDDAERFFRQVASDSELGLQAEYYLGVTQTARGDLGGATRTFAALVKREPRNADEQRVVELAQLALGRLFYERDQPSQAIDSYLLIDRKSDLFDEALYEVAWVYVKARQYDKALRALELLTLADPTSAKLPTVRILEGNLRIRRAQALKADMVMGIDQGKGNPAEEYLKADRAFAETRRTFRPPHDELATILAAGRDPREFMVQITGRVSKTFEVGTTMPEIAASWIREEPGVRRLVDIETDLGSIQDDIVEAERTIDRLDAALTSPNRVNIFPSLADKRHRATEIAEELFAIRSQLVAQERKLADARASGAERARLDQLAARRISIARMLAELPDAEVAFRDRIGRARASFDAVDQRAAEIQTVIDSTEATMVALRKYLAEIDPPPTPELKQQADRELRELGVELQQLRQALGDLRRDVVLGRDEAGTGDEIAQRARQLRSQLRLAYQAEHQAASALARGGGDRTRAQRIATLTGEVGAIEQRLDAMNGTIDAIVEEALVEVRETLSREKAELASYRREFLLYESESRDLGGTVLGDAFRDVKARFYDVIVRSDVGTVDTSWSQKEDSDEDLRRLELDRSRELRQLQHEFRDLLEEEQREQERQREEERAREPAPARPAPPPAGAGTPEGPR